MFRHRDLHPDCILFPALLAIRQRTRDGSQPQQETARKHGITESNKLRIIKARDRALADALYHTLPFRQVQNISSRPRHRLNDEDRKKLYAASVQTRLDTV